MQSPERWGEVKLPLGGNCWISAVDPNRTAELHFVGGVTNVL